MACPGPTVPWVSSEVEKVVNITSTSLVATDSDLPLPQQRINNRTHHDGVTGLAMIARKPKN